MSQDVTDVGALSGEQRLLDWPNSRGFKMNDEKKENEVKSKEVNEKIVSTETEKKVERENDGCCGSCS